LFNFRVLRNQGVGVLAPEKAGAQAISEDPACLFWRCRRGERANDRVKTPAPVSMLSVLKNDVAPAAASPAEAEGISDIR